MEENKIEDSNFQASEKNLVEETSGKASLGNEDVIRIRKEKIIKLAKKEPLLIAFILLAIFAIIWGIKEQGLSNYFDSLISFNIIKIINLPIWLLIFAIISAILVYYNKKSLSFYPILAWIVLLSVKIRTRNLPLLKDITTGTWTLGPDLDPFLFLRWAKYIFENGSLYAIDTMRYVPLGFNTKGELLLHPYMMAWFHKLALNFGSESVTQSAVLYPVFMFSLTVLAFFLFSRKVFADTIGPFKANIIASISSFFLAVFPVFLPRTIAGIPEKESAGFLFLFLSYYLFLCAWKAKKFKSGLLFGVLAGASTAAMALVWGGYELIPLTIGPAIFIVFLLGKMDKRKLGIYAAWIISSYLIMSPFSTRYKFINLLSSFNTGFAYLTLFIIAFHIFIFEPYLKKYFSSGKFNKVPSKIISLIIVLIAGFIILSILLGPSIIAIYINNVTHNLINPGSSRLIQTVAENRQTFFLEWVGSYGPFYRNLPIFFWLFFIGSIFLFYKMIYFFNTREKTVMTFSYVFFLSALIFSKYSPNSTFNGTNNVSQAFLSLGFILPLICFGYYYYKYHKKGEEEKLKNFDFGFILIFVIYSVSLVAARGAVRLILVLVPVVSIIAPYFIVESFDNILKMKNNLSKVFGFVIISILIIGLAFSGMTYYKIINAESAGYAPSIYTQQWQKAMAWVRENTPRDAVFGHWWDYGYWLQSIGERASVLDGGNAKAYWNHLMGRHALTSPNNMDALEFLYAHNTTHFLIDSSDIGKYTAFSSIGSDANYDRRSWLQVFLRDNKQVKETKNSTIFLYSGGTALDGDVLYDDNGSRIFLPGGNSGIGAVLIERDSSGQMKNQPQGIFVYQGKQYQLPLRYAFHQGKFIDFGSGVESGVFLFPRVNENSIEPDGALIYLSNRTVKSQLARLYLYKEDNPNFKLVHSEDDFIITQIKNQGQNIGDIVFYNGVRGPIRIWEINYPSDIEFKKEYLENVYPDEIRYG